MEKEHLEIILENMDRKFALLLEGHDTLRHEIRETRTELKQDINLCNFKIDALSQRIETVNKTLGDKIDSVEDKLTKRIDSVEDKLTKRIDSVENTLTKQINGVESKLTERIDGVETSLGQKIDAVATDLKAHRNDTEAHQIYQVKE